MDPKMKPKKRPLRPISSGVFELNMSRSITPSIDHIRGDFFYNKREGQKDVRAIISSLLRGDSSDRKYACVDLANLVETAPEEAKKAVPALIEAFKEGGPFTKDLVIETFALINDTSSFQALLSAARDENELIREKARIIATRINRDEMCP